MTAQFPEAILFDMDNTLHDFYSAKIASCEAVIDTIQQGDPTTLLRYFLSGGRGYENVENIRAYMHDLGIEDEELFHQASKTYEEVKLSKTHLYDGVKETLHTLSAEGIPMGIITDAESKEAEKRLRKNDIDHFFSGMSTPDLSGRRKPDEECFRFALTSLGITEYSESPERYWVVGDSPRREIEPANMMGMTSVYAIYGDWMKIPYPSIQPHHTINTFSEILTILNLSD